MTDGDGRASGVGDGSGVRWSVVLEGCIRLVFHAVLATSLFFLFSGHNAPGGGFIGGLVAGSALVLRYLGSSGASLRAEVRVGPTTLLGTGLLVAVGTAVAPFVLGGDPLESAYTYLDLPVLGELPLASVLAFDTGVYLIVVGLVLTILVTLGAQLDVSLSGTPDDPGAAP